LKFSNQFLQSLQVRNWICHTPVMSCYKEALVLGKIYKKYKIFFCCTESVSDHSRQIFFFCKIFPNTCTKWDPKISYSNFFKDEMFGHHGPSLPLVRSKNPFGCSFWGPKGMLWAYGPILVSSITPWVNTLLDSLGFRARMARIARAAGI